MADSGTDADAPAPAPRFRSVENPLITAWQEVMKAWAAGRLTRPQLVEQRRRCVEAWSWAIPNHAALHAIGGVGRVVEMGAGSGYWARLLRRRDVDVVAFDRAPGSGFSWARDGGDGPVIHTAVVQGEPEELRRHRDRALLLVWPPCLSHETGPDPPETGFRSFGRRCLEAYAGSTVIYVGEPRRVTAQRNRPSWTGDDTFFDLLHRQFRAVQWVAIPQWPAIHDGLWVMQRRQRLHLP